MRQIDMPDATWMLLHFSFHSVPALHGPQERLSLVHHCCGRSQINTNLQAWLREQISHASKKSEQQREQAVDGPTFPKSTTHDSLLRRSMPNKLVGPFYKVLHVRRVCVTSVVLTPGKLAVEKSRVYLGHLR
jgi:hypothetical protein